MAAELEQFCKDLEKRGYEKAAVSLRKQLVKLQERELLPDTLEGHSKRDSAAMRKELRNIRSQEVIDLANKLRYAFGADVDEKTKLSDLRRGRNPMTKQIEPVLEKEDKYPEWTNLLQDLSSENLNIITSSFHRAIAANYETIGDVRSAHPSNIRSIKKMGPLGTLFLSIVFAPTTKP